MNKLCFLTLLMPLCGSNAGEAWTNRLTVADRHTLAVSTCRWSEDGSAVRLTSTNHAVIELRLRPGREPSVRLQPERLFAEDFADRVQCWPVPRLATNLVSIAVRCQSHAWQVYVADQPVARFPEPWPGGGATLSHPLSALPAASQRDAYVQRTAPFRFEDSFTVPKTDGPEKIPDAWEACGGAWSLHTVTGALTGTVRGRGLARQPTPQHSPNFYSMEGRGHRAIALAGESFLHRYAFRAAVQHNGGTNGLVFLATDAGACHGFTVQTEPEHEQLIFQLWRGGVSSNAARQVLATVATELNPGQWTLMEARVLDDRVICLADNVPLIEQRLPLPPGGRFGLYADTAEGTRFDDVAVTSHEDYPFQAPSELAFNTLRRGGTFRPLVATEMLAAPGGDSEPAALQTPAGRAAREWVFGATDDGPHKLEICAQPMASGDGSLALLAGWQGDSRPGYRFIWRQAGGRQVAVLEDAGSVTGRCLDTLDLGPATRAPVRLTLDALRPHELRALVNGQLVALACPTGTIVGAGGMRAEGVALRLSLPRYVSQAPIYTDRFEKNPAFVNDPFMRHWASPEGQWITMPDGSTWLRGDVMSRVKLRLPTVEPSELHLMVPEDGTNGACVITVRDGRIVVRVPAAGVGARLDVAVTNVPLEQVEGAGNLRLLTVNLEDGLLWLSHDAQGLGQCHLPELPVGRRVRVSGLSNEMLHQTLVRRENVFDTLFNESLANWRIAGGRWEIVNRFQCEPSWSHMNGESADSLAALWSKVEMTGDFCVEFYAGMRMGWYERPGDFNLTVHSRRDATCDGYTVTTAGWDPDHSQLYTRLFRNGELAAASTAYTAPRVRAGSVREGYEPLISSGRPVHGAWYGMRLRRVGDTISYIFDNQPVLSWRDPSPLDGGALGIWTYRNSIMVARVRIQAEHVQPRRYRFWRLPDLPPIPPPAASVPSAAALVNGHPAEWLDPDIWQDADAVSRPLVRFFHDAGGQPVMRVSALANGGTFLVAPHVSAIPVKKLMGWRFEVARHPEAHFNFEYSVGAATTGKEIAVESRHSFVICGSDEARGERKLAGRLAQPPAATAPDAPPKAWFWTPVEVWLPTDVLRRDRVVAVDGFGNLQASDVQQGLAGNPPGAWYAVRNFREVYSGFPEIGAPPAARDAAQAFAAEAARLPSGRIQERRLPAAVDARMPAIAWVVRQEAEFGLAAHLDGQVSDAIRVSSAAPWPSHLLPARAARLDDLPASGWQEGNDYIVLLSRTPQARQENTTLSLDLADGRTFRQVVPLATAITATPPVLVSCGLPGSRGRIETFEARPFDGQDYIGRAGMAFCSSDPVQGACIRFHNRGQNGGRLDGRLMDDYDPVLTPLLQFRYKGDPMAHVSLAAPRCNIAFAEDWGSAAAPGATGILDNAWHTWFGVPLNTFSGGPLRQGYAVGPGELRVASRASRDQTGDYSSFSVDDIAAGPATGPKRPLACRFVYSAPDGVAAVRYAVASGSVPWGDRKDAERNAVHWLSATNEQVLTPDLSALPEGTHHLVVQARGTRGAWSSVSDLPFLLDRQAPKASCQIRQTPERYNGTCLDLDIEGEFAPPVLRELRLSCNGQKVDLTSDNGQFSCTSHGAHFEIDWPWLLRKFRRDCRDGDVLNLRLDGIVDAAGNEAPSLPIPITLTFSDDKQPPAVQPPATPANFLVFAPVFRASQDFFTSYQGMAPQPPQEENGSRFVAFRGAGIEKPFLARGFHDKGWNPETFPWLAVSVRFEGETGSRGAPFTLHVTPANNQPEGAAKPANGKDYIWEVPLADGQPFLVGHVDWRPGQWNDLLINVRDLLRAQMKTKQAGPVKDVGVFFADKTRAVVHVRAMAILAPWSGPDLFKLQAYDINGIAGLVWQNGGHSTLTGLRPARLSLPPQDPNWLRVRVSDKPGNLTPLFMLPMPPGGAPVAADLPVEVPVESL